MFYDRDLRLVWDGDFFYSINSTFSFKNSIIMENNVTPFYGKTHADCL